MPSWSDIFGFKIKDKTDGIQIPSVVPPNKNDGSLVVDTSVVSGGWQGFAYDIDATAKTENEQIKRYRETASYPEVDSAIIDIVNECIVSDQADFPVKLELDNLKISDQLKEKFQTAFIEILDKLEFNLEGHDIVRKWYIDGKIYFHILFKNSDVKQGIAELRMVDPMKIKKIRNIKKKNNGKGVEVVESIEEYYIYNDKGISETALSGIRLSVDSVVMAHSGAVDGSGMVVGFLSKAIKPANQLKMLEDAIVIYTITRAPDRRVFYIDVGNLPKIKAEQYVTDVMNKFKNKLVYNACLDMNTLIPLLDGRTLSLYEMQQEFEAGKEMWVSSCDPVTGKFAPGLVTSAGITKFDQKVVKITLDNGKTITCTLDHKFPTWNRGIVEAKDLVVGESMIPNYTRSKRIMPKSPSEYLQIFKNDTKKWEYAHRLVSNWKTNVGMDNEFVFGEEYVDAEKNTVHHVNFDRYNNSPLNLVRMNSKDHLVYHQTNGNLGGRIGGKVTAQRRKEQGIPQFNLTPEQRAENGRKTGLIVGPRMVLEQKGMFAPGQQAINSKLGSAALLEKLKDETFNQAFRQAQSDGWSEDAKAAASNRAKASPYKNKWTAGGNTARWSGPNSATNRLAQGARTRERMSTKFPANLFGLIEDSVKNNLNTKQTLEFVNTNIDTESFASLNKNRSSIISYRDITTVCVANGFSSLKTYRDAHDYRNHKITNIEFLVETMDVGTLGIDKDEKYHNYHTFALDAGIFTCNSTGEIADAKKNISMIEDFWMPRRDGCLTENTKISLLDGREVELGDLIAEFESGKENWTYSVSPDGKVVPGLITWAGITHKNATVLDITLDNGEVITATPDHKFILRDGTKIRAEHLIPGSSLMPFNTKKTQLQHKDYGNTYTAVQQNDTNEWTFTHRMVSSYMDRPVANGEVVHHIDFDRYNNDPSNLRIMTKLDHSALHSSVGRMNWTGDQTQHRARLSASGKAFFETDAGQARKLEIAANNLTDGRDTIATTRTMKVANPAATNHKVISVVYREEKMDVGTLTVDGDNLYHDYHNFALTAGVFVMNSKGTEITTLQGSQSLITADFVAYFQNKLYQSLNVPIGRMKPETGFSLGRTSEVSREELKFGKFISRLRVRFSGLFHDLLRIQLIAKGLIRADEWDNIRTKIRYDFIRDNHFTELKETELLSNRISVLQTIDPYLGKYYSKAWIMKNVLMFADDEVDEMEKEIKSEGDAAVPTEISNQMLMMQAQQDMAPEQPEEDPGAADQELAQNQAAHDQKMQQNDDLHTQRMTQKGKK